MTRNRPHFGPAWKVTTIAGRKPRRTSTLGQIRAHRDHFRAQYTKSGVAHTPGHTFATFALADHWLASEQLLIARDEWTPPAQRRAAAQAQAIVNNLTLEQYAETWLKNRRVRGRALRPRTIEHYQGLLSSWLAPLTPRPIVALTRAEVTAWYLATEDKKTMRKHAYDLLRSILRSAVREGVISENPCDIPGASSKPRPAKILVATAQEVAQLAQAMPQHHQLTVLLAAWCGLRFGEIAALRRSDVEIADGSILLHVRRGVVRVNKTSVEGPTKSDAGVRDVVVPPHLRAAVVAHLENYAQRGVDGLVFPSRSSSSDFLTEGQLMGHKAKLRKDGTVQEPATGFRGAREAIGREDISFHKLRHHAGTSYAIAGATTQELLEMMGHSDVHVALLYQHTAQGRGAHLAARMSELAEGPRE